MYDQFLELAGVDITREPMEVGPTCHYAMGGIRVDAETGSSAVPGLFAAGESAGGMHGANRLGGNSLSDLLVFGRRAGEGSARYAAEAPLPRIDPDDVADAADEMTGFLSGSGTEGPYELEAELQAMMQERVGIFREEQGLTTAISALADLRARAANVRAPGGRAFNPAWNLCRDLRNLLTCAEAIARAALLRSESRGAHSRLDHPDFDEYWGEHNIVVRKGPDGMVVEARPAVRVPELAPLVDERKAQERQ
jgi:succinate dehydrogenase / fumarate reductase flavoprotein subunit